MITAKNYAAEAERDLNIFMRNETLKGRNISGFAEMLNLIANAKHFAIPDNGMMLNDEGKGIENKPFKLPYPITCIEFTIDYLNSGLSKGLITCKESNEGVQCYLSVCCKDPSFWHLLPISLYFKSGISPLAKNELICEEIKSERYNLEVSQVGTIYANYVQQFLKRPLIEFFEALACDNTYVQSLGNFNHKKKNEKLKKAGKLPLYETKILVVDSQPKNVDTTDYGGTHASPRQHLRRGHIRRLASGKTIWINNQIIGKASNGKIDKSYSVI